MRLRYALLAVLSVVCLGTVLEAHEVSGTVEVVLKAQKKKADLSTLIVFIDEIKGAGVPGEEMNKDFVMSTKNKQLSPRTMAVPVGATVNFPNYDPIFHNLFSVSAPNQFDLGLYKGGASKSQTFAKPGIVRIFCNVHPQMSASIVVANSSYYVNADKDGNFDLGNVPNGTYLLRAYVDEGQVEQKIQVGNTPLKVKLTIDAQNYRKMKHKNKFGKDYATDENEKY